MVVLESKPRATAKDQMTIPACRTLCIEDRDRRTLDHLSVADRHGVCEQANINGEDNERSAETFRISN